MEEVIKIVTLYLAWFVEIAAGIIIGIAAARALWRYFGNLLGKDRETVPKEDIRLALGRSLSLALEFLLGADILQTAVAPTWNEIGQLAAIAVLRTGLNYFLDRELRNSERQK